MQDINYDNYILKCNMQYSLLFPSLLKFRLAGGSKPKIFEESSEEEEDEETPEEKGKTFS